MPLNLPYTQGILVSPYKHDLYGKIENYIQQNTLESDTIVFTGINRYFSIFSGRHDVFRDNVLTFTMAAFYPPLRRYPIPESPEFEKEIVLKMKTAKPKLVLFPEVFRKLVEPEDSLFVAYIEQNWQVVTRIGNDSLKNPYEVESPVLIYKMKP